MISKENYEVLLRAVEGGAFDELTAGMRNSYGALVWTTEGIASITEHAEAIVGAPVSTSDLWNGAAAGGRLFFDTLVRRIGP